MKLTRRELVKLGAGATAAGLSGGWSALLADSKDRIEVTIPSSGRKVPAVGIGTVKFRGDTGSAAMDGFRKTLQTFHRLGGRVVDTSPNYGNSEEVLGHLLADSGLRREVFMATKVDRENAQDGVARMESSFGRLGKPIDLMQVHNLRGTDEVLPVMFDWKEQGRLGHVGITTHRVSQHADIEKFMLRYPLDFIQVNYSLADRAAAGRLLPLAMDRGVAVLVNRPFGRGELFGAVKGVDLPGWAAEFGAESWGQVFLKYIISHPAQTLPIPGTSKPHHAEDNLGAMYGTLPDPAQRRVMEQFIDRLI